MFTAGVSGRDSTERSNPFRQPRKFPRGGIFVDDAAGDAARELGLGFLERLGGIGLLARIKCRLDGLDEGPDAADSSTVDLGAIGVAADALLGLRRVRHRKVLRYVRSKRKSGARPRAAPTSRSPSGTGPDRQPNRRPISAGSVGNKRSS